MSYYFYLSCADADNDECLLKFVVDLNVIVLRELGLSGKEEVGFFSPGRVEDGQNWRPKAAAALRTSQTMVALISPNYFESEAAGKEWQIFETRRRLIDNSGVNHSPIIPLIWIPCTEPTPKVAVRAQYDWGEPFKAYCMNGLKSLMTVRSPLPSFGNDYWIVLNALAKHIIELGQTVKLPSLDAIQPFNEVKSAFNAPQAPLDFTSGLEDGRKLKAAIVENNAQVREMLVQYLSVFDYDCHPYSEAEEALESVLNDPIDPFDVVLVDLELEPKGMQGLSLIEEIARTDKSPPVIALSPGSSNSEFIQALKVGAHDVVPKPFDLLHLRDIVQTVALIGRGRRQFRQSPGLRIGQRERPVFLSYSNIDRRTAKILKTQIEARGFGVWYAPDSLSPADPTMEGISDGLAEAEVFVPLVTDNFARSPWCVFEMVTSLHGRKVIIPVVEGYLDRMRNFEMLKPITDKFVCDITFDRFADGLTVLLGHIQRVIKKDVRKVG